MVKLIEFESIYEGKQIALFNDENIAEKDVVNIITSGEYSPEVIIVSKKQYENVFKSKNSVIKELRI